MSDQNKQYKLTCETCKYWGSYRKGACDAIGSMSITNVDIGWNVLDDSGLEVWLETTKDFGCVNHVLRGRGTEND